MSISTLPTAWMSPGAIAMSARRPKVANPTPSAIATPDSIRLSMRKRRTRRPVLAPMATHTATSWERPALRASNRLATLAQAISRTIVTAPKRIQSVKRTSPRTTSSIDSTNAPRLTLSPGFSNSRSAAIATISALASVTVIPGTRRPISRTQWLERGDVVGDCWIGAHMSTPFAGKSSAAGNTPTILWLRSSIRMSRPSTSGSAAKATCQNSSERTTTRSPSGRSSAGLRPRPICGATPRIFLEVVGHHGDVNEMRLSIVA